MRLHPKTEELIARMGRDIQTWRKIQRLTATVVAGRAGITRTTLRSIEANPGTASFENVLAVLAVWSRSFPPGVAAPLLAALVASTAFSNGIMFRPQASLIMPLALVAATAAWHRKTVATP